MAFFICLIVGIWIAFIQLKLDGIIKRLDKIEKTVSVSVRASVVTPENVVALDSVPPVVESVESDYQNKESVVDYSVKDAEVEKFSDQNKMLEVSADKVRESLDSKGKKVETDKSNSFQDLFLGNILNKVGAFAIIIAIIILIGLVSSYITSGMKIAFAYILGAGMYASALYMHKKDDLKRYSEVLLGTGIGTLFITTFCAYGLFHLINGITVITIGVALLIATFELAHRMKTPSMIVVALLGGYLTPCFSGVDYEISLWYLVFLNMISLTFTYRNQKYSFVNIINLVLTMLAFLPYVVEPSKPILPLALWAIYIVYDILRDKSNAVDNALSIVNYAVLSIFSLIIFRNIHIQLGLLLSVTALFYAVLAWYVRRHSNYLCKVYSNFLLINLWLGTFFIFDTIYNVMIWSVVALSLAILVNKRNLKFLSNMVLWFIGTAVAGVFFAKSGGTYVISGNYTPIYNIRTLVFGFPIVSSLLLVFLSRVNKDELSANLFLFSGLTLTYVYLLCEVLSVFTAIFPTNSSIIEYNRLIIYCIIGCLYAVNSKILFKTTKFELFDISSIMVYGLSALCLVLASFEYSSHPGYMPVFNLCALAYLIAIFSLLNISKTEFAKYLAVILGFILVNNESIGLAKVTEGIGYVISLAWVLYAGIITTVGILKDKRFLLNSGIAVIILSIFRIFIFDLARVDAFYKLVAFLALGIILMYVSYVYASNKKNLK